MKAVMAMMHDQDLPMHLWAEVARTIIYVQNRTSHHVLGNQTLEEMFIGEKPKVNHQRIFGCLVYVHVPKDKRKSLGHLGKKGIFFGYNETSKAYLIYIPCYKQIETSTFSHLLPLTCTHRVKL